MLVVTQKSSVCLLTHTMLWNHFWWLLWEGLRGDLQYSVSINVSLLSPSCPCETPYEMVKVSITQQTLEAVASGGILSWVNERSNYVIFKWNKAHQDFHCAQTIRMQIREWANQTSAHMALWLFKDWFIKPQPLSLSRKVRNGLADANNTSTLLTNALTSWS